MHGRSKLPCWVFGTQADLVVMQCLLDKSANYYIGEAFVVTFSSHSHFLTLKSSWKSHQMTPFFVQKEVFGEKCQCFYSNNYVFTLKSWWLESERTRARGKRNHKFCAIDFSPFWFTLKKKGKYLYPKANLDNNF